MGTDAARPRILSATFGLVAGGALAYFTSYAMLIPTLPRFVEGPLGGGDVAVGIVSGSFAFSALALRPWVGRVGDRRGRRLLLIAGAASVTASVLALTVVDALVPVIALRLVAGAGEAMFFVGAMSAINDIAPAERRGEAVSLFSVSLYIGVAVGPILGESIQDASGFDAAFAGAAALTAIALGLALLTPDTRPRDLPPATHTRLLHPAGIVPGVVMFTSVFGFAGYMAFIPLYVGDVGLSGARGVLLMYGAILVAIRLIGARIPDIFGVERVGRAGLALSMTGLAIAGSWRTVAGLFTGTAVFAIGQALAFPAFMALAAGDAPPAERGAAVGTTTAFIDLGFALGPISAGVLAARFSDASAFLGGAAMAAAGLALQLILSARSRIPH